MKRSLFLAGLFFVLASGTLSSAAPATNDILETYAAGAQMSYSETLEAANTMEQALISLLAAPSQPALDKARKSWVTAHTLYQRTLGFYIREDLTRSGLIHRLDAWPVNPAFIDYVRDNPDSGLINDSETPVTLATVLGKHQLTDETDVAAGWHVLEFLLWGQDLSEQTAGQRPFADYIAGDRVNNRRREYLMLATTQLLEDLGEVAATWKPGADTYRAGFVRQGDASLTRVLGALATLNGHTVADKSLAAPLTSANPQDEHSAFSDTTHLDLLYAQQGTENIYFGRFGTVTGASLHDLLTARDPELAQEIAATLRQTTALIAALPAPFDHTVTSPRPSLSRQQTEQTLAAIRQQAELFLKAGKTLGLEGVRIDNE